MPWPSLREGRWILLDWIRLAGEMQIASAGSTQDFGATPQRPWYRHGVILLSLAVGVLVFSWLIGWFDSSLIDRLKQRVSRKPVAKLVVQTAPPPVEYVPPAPIGNDVSISQVPLPLILTGTMPGRNAHEGSAFIGVYEESPQTYSAGATLLNDARIVEIYTDHVVLERDGQRVDLYLHGTGKTSDNKRFAAMLNVGGMPPPAPIKITNRDVLTDYIRPSPVYEGQWLKGFRVYPGQHAGVFSQMGLQGGDVVTAINGVALSEAVSSMEQFKQVANGYAVTATVLRQEKLETLSLDGALIVQNEQRLQNPPEQTDPPFINP